MTDAARPAPPADGPAAEPTTTVLVPVALPSSGPGLLRVARALVPPARLRVVALHLADPDSPVPLAEEAEALRPLLAASADEPPVPTRAHTFPSRAFGRDIAEAAHEASADLVLMGWHKPVVSQSILGGPVYDVLQHTRADVAVYLERIFRPWRRVLVPYVGGMHDRGALAFADRIAAQTGAEITILHVVPPGQAPESAGEVPSEAGLRAALAPERLPGNVRLRVVEHADALEAAVAEAKQGYDLVVVGVSETWGLEPSPFSERHERLARECPVSLLIVRRYLDAPAPGRRPERRAEPAPRGGLPAPAAP